MKKNLKKLLAVLLAAAMTLSMCLTAVASVFPDVTDENYPWAIDAIEAMAEEGIIKGRKFCTKDRPLMVSLLYNVFAYANKYFPLREKCS